MSLQVDNKVSSCIPYGVVPLTRFGDGDISTKNNKHVLAISGISVGKNTVIVLRKKRSTFGIAIFDAEGVILLSSAYSVRQRAKSRLKNTLKLKSARISTLKTRPAIEF